MSIRFAFFSLIALLFIGCGAIKPKKPEIIIQPITPIQQPPSRLSIPIEISLTPYFKLAEKEAPLKLADSKQQCEGTSVDYRFERDPLSFSGKGSKLHIGIAGKYALKVNYCPKCTGVFYDNGNCIIPRLYASCGEGESMRRIQIAYETSFDISSNYNLISKTELKKITPVDPCEITFLKYNATKHVVDEVEVELKKMAKEVDKLIQSTDVKKEITAAWNALTAPIVIPNYGFVYVNPTSIGIDKLELKGSNLHFNLGLEAFPSAQLQPKLEYTPKTLPNLSKIDTETEGFTLYFEIFGTYDSLSNLLTKTLKGKEFEIKRNQIILDDIRVFGAKGNKLTIQAKFSGKKSGILYLEGTPVFDAEKQEISFPDLQYNLDTKNILLKSAKWLLNDRITHSIRSMAKYSLKPYLEQAAKQVEKEMNRSIDESISTYGNVKSIDVEQIFPTENELQIRTKINGKLGVKIK
jgi:hypothetical protein